MTTSLCLGWTFCAVSFQHDVCDTDRSATGRLSPARPAGCDRRARAGGAVKHETLSGKRGTGNPLDLRRWLSDIERLGELKEVRGAEWNLELGAISELNVKKEKPPALLFDEITGYPKGFRVLTCSTSSPSRLSSILRLPVQPIHKGLVQQLRGKPSAWQSEASKYKPVFVDKGPIFENAQKGAQVDVLTFPAPFWHEL